MKIAVTYEDGLVFQHFGHTEQFKVYTIEGGNVVASEIVSSDGAGHGALAQVLDAHQIDALICGGIGGGARAALGNVGIQVFGGVSGSADAAAEAFARGELAWNPGASCSGHGHHHEEGHACGSHGCGGGCH
ncbi:MAG: NifB/NifX family molybdenum-iron cluster-binding protein [Butyricicoccaceae bacterium]